MPSIEHASRDHAAFLVSRYFVEQHFSYLQDILGPFSRIANATLTALMPSDRGGPSLSTPLHRCSAQKYRLDFR